MKLMVRRKQMYPNHLSYDPSDVHPKVLELITKYDDLVATQISLISTKKNPNKQLKEHLERQQSQLIDEIDALRNRLFSLQFC